MPAMAIGCAYQQIASTAPIARILETIRVLADSWNDQPSAVDPFEDRDDVHGKDADPREHEEEAQHAPEPERRETDDARHHDVGEQQHELGDHEHDTVLRVPL